MIPGILAELHAEGLRDYLVLHRMAAEHGRSGAFNWSWREHRERTAYARRVARGNLTDEHAAEQVTERLWRLKGAEVRQTVRRPDGQEAWVRIGPFGLIDIPAAIQHGTSLERARIALNPALYEGAHKDAAQPHFALLPDEALTLEGPRLRLAVLVTLAMRYARDEHGVVVRSAAALWEDLTTHGGVPAQKRWPRAATVLQRALEQLTKLNPKDDRGRRRHKHHQFLTEDIGHPHLSKHLASVTTLMRVSSSWGRFMKLMNKAFPARDEQQTLPFPEHEGDDGDDS